MKKIKLFICVITFLSVSLLSFQEVVYAKVEAPSILMYTGSPTHELLQVSQSTEWVPVDNELALESTTWLKIVAPKGNEIAPYIYHRKAPPYLAAYQNGKKIYQFGTLENIDPRMEHSFRWDMYAMNPDYPLYIKVYSEIPPIQIGSKEFILESMIKTDLARLIGNTGTLILALLSIFVFLFNKEQRLPLYFACFAFSLSILGFLRVETKQLLLDHGLLYFYLNLMFSIAGPAFLILFLSHLFTNEFKKWSYRIQQLFVLLGGLAVLLISVWPDSFWIVLPVLNILLLGSMVTVIAMLILAYWKGRNRHVGLAILGISSFIGFYLFGIILNRKGISFGIDFGLLANYSLVFACVGVIISHFMELHRKMENYAEELEMEVKGKTEELRHTHLQLLHSVQESATTMLELSALEERNRIAHEIHDVVGHTLTTTVLQMEASKRLIDKQPQVAKEKLELSQNLVRKGLEEIRSSVRLLKEAEWSFELKGFLEKLMQETMKYSDVHINYKIDELPDLPSFHKYALFLTLKEGLTNGMKHGHCDQFHFELRYLKGEGMLTFILANNGRTYVQQPYGFGLTSMKERVDELGGSLRVYAEQPWGCIIRLSIPINT